MENKIRAALHGKVTIVDIVNDSSKHAAHFPNAGQTHFRLYLIKPEGLSRLEAHRLVYKALEPYMRTGPLHALSLIWVSQNKA